MSESAFQRLLRQAQAAPISGWDFSFVEGRMHDAPLPWDYRERVLALLPATEALLDMGTGGGELLSGLRPLPPTTYATEAYPPNVPVARARLAPLGVQVVPVAEDEDLPLPSCFFDLVINRHERFIAAEVARVLQPGGRFVTQQVGERNLEELNGWLTGSPKRPRSSYLQKARAYLEAAGMEVTAATEALGEARFDDVGAIVYLLRAASWAIPDFSVARYEPQLWALHRQIETNGPLVARDHRFYLEAIKHEHN